METPLCGIRNINHEHREVPPVIHIHNKTPFANYDTAIDELKKKILHPGEIAIAYYYNPTADDGISTLIATGPIQQGGYNEIFKNAADIDKLVEDFNLKIDSQEQHVIDVTDEALAEVLRRAAEMNASTKDEISTIVNSSISEFTETFNTTISNVENSINSSFNSLVENITSSIQTLSDNVNTSIAELSESTDTRFQSIESHIDSSISSLASSTDEKIENLSSRVDELATRIDASYVEIDERIQQLESQIDTSIQDFTENLAERIETLSSSVDERFNELSEHIDASYIYINDIVTNAVENLDEKIESLSSSTSDSFESVYVELDTILEMLGVDPSTSGSGTINKIREDVESNTNALYWRPLGTPDPDSTDYGYWRDLADSSN